MTATLVTEAFGYTVEDGYAVDERGQEVIPQWTGVRPPHNVTVVMHDGPLSWAEAISEHEEHSYLHVNVTVHGRHYFGLACEDCGTLDIF